MSLNNFCLNFLPYCVMRQPDGHYAVLNREYKPVGFFTEEHIVYEQYPVLVRFKGLTPTVAVAVSWSKSPNTDCIYLYDDGCTPTHSRDAMEQYMARLQKLAKLKIEKPKQR